jgi:1,4-alpha-glucan branching enzyme
MVCDRHSYGIHVIDDAYLFFRIYAPAKRSVVVVGNFNEWNDDDPLVLDAMGDGDFCGMVSFDSYPVYYQYIIDDTIAIPDPMSRSIVSWSDVPDFFLYDYVTTGYV